MIYMHGKPIDKINKIDIVVIYYTYDNETHIPGSISDIDRNHEACFILV